MTFHRLAGLCVTRVLPATGEKHSCDTDTVIVPSVKNCDTHMRIMFDMKQHPAPAHLCFSFLISKLGFFRGGGFESEESFLAKGRTAEVE